MKQIIRIALALAYAIMVAPMAHAKETTNIPVDAIALNGASLNLQVGDIFLLSATVSPNNATDKSLTWKSSRPQIISVTQTGKVKALQEGKAVIIVTSSNGKQATCNVSAKENLYPELGFVENNGKLYWYERRIRQGIYGDPKNIRDKKYGYERGREIFDAASNAWYWLDVYYDGAAAFDKEVWIPYIYQTDVEKGINTQGKWVRYNDKGAMVKGWYKVSGKDAKIYPKQAGNVYYYDPDTGAMTKGFRFIDGKLYHFDETTGVLT